MFLKIGRSLATAIWFAGLTFVLPNNVNAQVRIPGSPQPPPRPTTREEQPVLVDRNAMPTLTFDASQAGSQEGCFVVKKIYPTETRKFADGSLMAVNRILRKDKREITLLGEIIGGLYEGHSYNVVIPTRMDSKRAYLLLAIEEAADGCDSERRNK